MESLCDTLGIHFHHPPQDLALSDSAVSLLDSDTAGEMHCGKSSQ